MRKRLVKLALTASLSFLLATSSHLAAQENGAYPTSSCPSGQCGLPRENGAPNGSCPSGQCGLPRENGAYHNGNGGGCASGQCGLPQENGGYHNGNGGGCASGQCGLPQENGGYHNGNGGCPSGQCGYHHPNYGCNPGWEAGIEIVPGHCGSCRENPHHRFLPDSDTNSYEYYNYYESDCGCGQY